MLGICARGPWTLYPLVIDNLPLTREETEAPSLSVGRDRAQRELEFEPALPETGAPVLIPHLAGKPGALPLSLPQTTRPCRHLTFLLRIKFLKKKKESNSCHLGFGARVLRLQGSKGEEGGGHVDAEPLHTL